MSLWLPTSAGMVPSDVWRLHLAARDYDERLSVGRDENNGAWTVFIAVGAGKPPHPVLYLGLDDELPTPDGLKERLYRADAVRHGESILDHMNKQNDDLLTDVRARADDATWEVADTMESFLHRQGLAPYMRSVRKLDPKQRSSR